MRRCAIDLTTVLDDQHLAVLKLLPPGVIDLHRIDDARSQLRHLVDTAPDRHVRDDVTVHDFWVPGGVEAPDVLVRCYQPATLTIVPSPALYWIHGGGMVMGSVAMNDPDCAHRAATLGAPVFSVEYRLAPEHPFPAPLDDCYAGLAWLAAQADDLGVDPGRIVVAGASAGGGLAASLTLMARDRGGPAIAHQVLVFPMLDHRNELPSTYAITDPRVWNREANQTGWNAYLGDIDRHAVPALASPAMADDLVGLPPADITVGQYDLFLDEDIAYAQALLAAGVACDLHVYPGAFHGSHVFVADAPVSRRWRRDEEAALRGALFPDWAG